MQKVFFDPEKLAIVIRVKNQDTFDLCGQNITVTDMRHTKKLKNMVLQDLITKANLSIQRKQKRYRIKYSGVANDAWISNKDEWLIDINSENIALF